MNVKTPHTPDDQHGDGFTLIELIIVVAIIGVMVSIAIPTIHAYLDRSRVASALVAGRVIQAALLSYATTSNYDTYPASIASYGELTELVNENGASLKDTEVEMGFEFRNYTPIDSDGDGADDRYTMSFKVSGVPTSRLGWCIVIAPSGVTRCEPE